MIYYINDEIYLLCLKAKLSSESAIKARTKIANLFILIAKIKQDIKIKRYDNLNNKQLFVHQYQSKRDI